MNVLMTDKIAGVDKARGHRFCPPQAVLKKIPKLYETDSIPADDKIVRLRYFGGGSAYWLIVELDQETGEAFGYAELFAGCGEWGYIFLPELAEFQNPNRPWEMIERDLYLDENVTFKQEMNKSVQTGVEI
jgi:hypothetical protein